MAKPSKLRLIARYRHSRNHNRGMPAIVGPRTFTNSPRQWLVKARLYLPAEHGSTEQAAIDLDARTDGRVLYSDTALIARDLIHEMMVEHPEWIDFTWEVWT